MSTSYQIEDMTALASARSTFFSIKMFDYAITLACSLPRTWDAFRKTLQPDINGLKIRADRESIARTIRGKVLAEGQRRENDAREEAALAARYQKWKPVAQKEGAKAAPGATDKPKRVCTYCKKKGHLAERCWKKAADEKTKLTGIAKVTDEDTEVSPEDVYYAH